MGIAITCRQYYLALVPAAALLAYFLWRDNHAPKVPRWGLMVFLSLLAAILPVILMVAVWRGLSSPAMAAGASYGNWRSAIGSNFTRPLVAARSEEHTSELQSHLNLVCRLLLEKKKIKLNETC